MVSIFTTQQPSNSNATDGVEYELGMKFRSAQNGQIVAIRFWKAPSESGTHVGKIWSASNTLLASTTFANETASGWQQQALSSPLTISANTTYVVSVNTANTYFVISSQGLASSVVNGDVSSVADGSNGVYGNVNALPTNSYMSSNYFRDIVFTAQVTASITKVSGDNQQGAVGTALPNPLVVQVKNSAGNPQVGVTVNFTVTNGGGTISPTSAVTDANGKASTVLTLGTTPATNNTVSATAANIGTVIFSALAEPKNPNPIYLENKKPGTTNWKITNQSTSNEIVGYATATSVNKGGSLPIKVSLAQPGQFTIDIYRLGYYQGNGGRLIVSSGSLSGITQPALTLTDSATKLYEATNWSTSYTVAVGNNWTSGLYVAKLTQQATGKQSQVWFVVRDDSRNSDIVFQSSFTTYFAYNNTGGYSTYAYQSVGGQRGYKVSSDRPLSMTTSEWHHYNQMTLWERNMVRWLESQSYDVSYITNIDFQTNSQILQGRKVFLSVGHDEYWSLEQRNAVEQARSSKINLAFFSSNTAYWRVRFENSNGGQANRVMACYKNTADTVAPTNKWRSTQNNRPENALLGIMYTGDRDDLYYTWGDPNGSTNSYSGYDFVVANSSDPYYANTNLTNGSKLTQLVAFEWDAVVNNGAAPSGLVILGQSTVSPTNVDEDLPTGTNTQVSHAVRYTAASGAKVFSTGSNQWMWGLDSDRITPAREDNRAKQIAVNVFADMGAKPQTPGAGIIVP
ncbi:N,N-dimethylformamidase beta subunit family domain-containing protein [Tolypothrix sp. VBCCA 56010]|uniref:N,N-dimethylformamidase beta subunit family domain-containing protein n=1 Tax=Tolypothrix sp. VBCCA 56010 TaxID=3137731 RepID=UPI003D7E57DC